MRIAEVYPFIQGELPNTGRSGILVRLQGCPEPHCKWCDTKYALDPKGGTEMSVDEISEKVVDYEYIYISGGEPFLQGEELGKLASRIPVERFLEISTSAFYPVPDWVLDVDEVTWVVDVKCPSSGRESKEIDSWLALSESDYENVFFKFVVSDEKDLRFVEQVADITSIVSPAVTSNGLQIIDNGLRISEAQLKWFQIVATFCQENEYLFSLQQHKFCWGNVKGK